MVERRRLLDEKGVTIRPDETTYDSYVRFLAKPGDVEEKAREEGRGQQKRIDKEAA